MIKSAIVLPSGFTQNLGKRNGFDEVWEGLRPLVKPDTTLITPVPWNFDVVNLANFLERHLDQEDHTILVAAYSWGGGWGFPRFARECNKRGLKIRAAVLCDPVYRSPYFLMKWRSMFNRTPILTPTIKVPENVHEVFWYYQRQNKPQAHKLVAMSDKTTIHQGVQLTGLTHQYMDDSHIFREHVTKLFTKLLA